MDQTTIIQIIHHLKESLINSGIKVDSIALFDSVLTGEMHDDSDIDIMLVSVDFEDKDIFERAKLTMFPEIMTFRKFKVPMDILNMSPEEYNQMNQKLMFQTKIVA